MADLQTIFYQIILSVLRDSEFTSASPGQVNRFIGVSSGSPEIGTSAELREAILSIIGEDFEDDNPDNLEKNLRNVQEKKGLTEGQAIGLTRKGIGTAQNPASIVAMGIQFLPHAALVILAISLAPLIFDILTKPGGPLDLRFKRIVDDEINAFLSRQAQKDTEFGTRQVIIQARKGFTASNGENSFNTLRGIREGGLDKERLDRLGMVDHSKGIFEDG